MLWIALSAACGEIGCLYVLLLLAWQMDAAAPPPGWLVAAVLLTATLVALLSSRVRRPTQRILFVTAPGAVVGLLLAFLRPEHAALMAASGAAAWWRGVAATEYTRSHAQTTGVIVGLAGISLLPLVAQLFRPHPGWTALAMPYYAVFFAGSLAALTLSRTASLRRRWRGGSEGDLWRVTGPLALLSGAGLFLVPALLAWALTGRNLSAFGQLFGWVGSVLIYVFLWLLALILAPLEGLMQLFHRWLSKSWQAPLGAGPQMVKPGIDMVQAPPSGLEQVLGAIALALLLAVIVATVLRWLRRSYQGAVDTVPEERESTFSWRKSGRSGHAAAHAATMLIEPLDGSPAGRLRRLYRYLQRAGAKAGRARQPSETPSEYLAALSRMENGLGVVARITALYLEVRYGEVLPAPAAVAALEQAADPAGGDLR